jgi:phosphatidate cytidylyltransferase
MHEYLVLYILLAVPGLAGIWLIISRSGTSKHAILIKSTVYLFIVLLSIAALLFHFFHLLAAVILAGIWLELILLLIRQSRKWPVNALFVSLLAFISFGFFRFSRTASGDELFLLLLVVFTFDAFCQITGQLAGKHKLFPKISPDKTVDGFLGGFAIAILGAMIACYLMHMRLLPTLGEAALIALAALAGDLLASGLKRINGIKDFSNWIPGQGGFLDRFNSLIFAGFSMWLLCLSGWPDAAG